jgi:hypothetical protein
MSAREGLQEANSLVLDSVVDLTGIRNRVLAVSRLDSAPHAAVRFYIYRPPIAQHVPLCQVGKDSVGDIRYGGVAHNPRCRDHEAPPSKPIHSRFDSQAHAHAIRSAYVRHLQCVVRRGAIELAAMVLLHGLIRARTQSAYR